MHKRRCTNRACSMCELEVIIPESVTTCVLCGRPFDTTLDGLLRLFGEPFKMDLFGGM
jgi:hypothetical protein